MARLSNSPPPPALTPVVNIFAEHSAIAAGAYFIESDEELPPLWAGSSDVDAGEIVRAENPQAVRGEQDLRFLRSAAQQIDSRLKAILGDVEPAKVVIFYWNPTEDAAAGIHLHNRGHILCHDATGWEYEVYRTNFAVHWRPAFILVPGRGPA